MVEDVKLNTLSISQQDISIKEKKLLFCQTKIVLMTASGVSKANLDDGREIAANFHWSFDRILEQKQ